MNVGNAIATGVGVMAAGALGYSVHAAAKSDRASGGSGVGPMVVLPMVAVGTAAGFHKLGGRNGAIVGAGLLAGALGGIAAAAVASTIESSRKAKADWSNFGPIKEGAVVGQVEWGAGPVDVVVTGVREGSDFVRWGSDFAEWYPDKAEDTYLGSVTEATTRKEYAVAIEFRHQDGSIVDVSTAGPASRDLRDRGLPQLRQDDPRLKWTDTEGDGITVVDLPWLGNAIIGAPSDGPRNMPMTGSAYRTGEAPPTFPELWEDHRRRQREAAAG